MKHLLIERFFEAAGQWSEEFRDREGKEVAFWVMLATGGTRFVARLGKRNLTGLAKEEIDKLTVGDVYGYHTLDQCYDWITQLVDEHGFFEPFVITAVATWVEGWLERQIEGYGKGIARLRRVAELAREELEASPDDASLLASVQYMERLATPSLHEMRKRRKRLDRWRELMGPVTCEESISAWYDAQRRT